MFDSTGLDTAVSGLRRLRKPDLDETIGALFDLRTASRYAGIVHQLAPERFAEIRTTTQARNGPSFNTPLENALLETLQHQFPLGWMEEQFSNLDPGEEPVLMIEPQCYWLSDYDFIEADFEHDFDSGAIRLDASAAYFAKFLDCGMCNKEIWDKAIEYFGWPKVYPSCATTDRVIDRFDSEKFEQLLIEHQLEDLLLIFQVIWKASGNYFFDFSDDDGGEYLTLTFENVLLLKGEWIRATEMMQAIEELTAKIQDNPAILALIMGFWDACLEYKKPKPKALVEVFGNQESILGRPERLVDPFYGPLTGEVDELETEEAWA